LDANIQERTASAKKEVDWDQKASATDQKASATFHTKKSKRPPKFLKKASPSLSATLLVPE
jgi:hypothetical protein